jgi:glycosyltransferase involved in cell wall biosynthesis
MICVASFVEKKGHKYLIEACRLLRERGVSFELKLVGGNSVNHGDGQTEVIRLVDEAGLNDVVEFTGKRPQSEIRELLTWADAGVLACCIRPNGDQDGLPNFLTECLAMGRPVVSTRQAGVMELVTDGVEGLLVRTRDARQLADALERLAKNPEMRREMGIAGRKTVEAGHNVDVNTERLFDIYLERAGSRRANAADSTNR